MIQVAAGTKVYLACRPVSMRYGFDGLAAQVGSVLAADPFSGHVFIFRSKRADYLKILYYDGTGLCLFAKRLESGKFVWPPIVDGGMAPLVEVACWSHARRYFFDLHHKTASPIALEVLEQIAALFAIEGHIRGRPPNLRAAARREHAQPRLDRLKSYLDIQITRISGKSDLAEAIRYTLSRWKALTRYVREGRLEMSNNAAERAMKPPVIGRKNYLFCGLGGCGSRAR